MFISCHEKEAFPFIAPKTTLAAFKGFSTSKKRGPQNRLYKLYRLARHVSLSCSPSHCLVGGLELLSHTEPPRSQAVGSLQLQN